MDDQYKKGIINAGLAPPPPPVGGLSRILRRPDVNGLYYNRQTLALDGYRFIGCRFDSCTLIVASPNFDLIRCVIDPSTTIQYGRSVMKIIQLFNSRFDWAYQHFPGFVPVRNDDGTITIAESLA